MQQYATIKMTFLYEKLSKPASHKSITALFDFLIESQRENIKYLAEQLAAQCAPQPETVYIGGAGNPKF